MPEIFDYGTGTLTVSIAVKLASGEMRGVINEKARAAITRSQRDVEAIARDNKTVYGITTGFGILANTKISEEDVRLLQHKILQSHSVGVGDPIAPELAKLMLITKVHALARGFSGVQLSTLERICWHIDNDVIPIVPEKGSVGASGDLAPLAHLFLPLVGLGELTYKNKRYSADSLMRELGVQPITLGPKEGLALINGTQFILAFAVKSVQLLHNCLEAADIIGAMSLEALTGTKAPFDERLHELRPYAGSKHVAARLRKILSASEIMQSHIDCGRV